MRNAKIDTYKDLLIKMYKQLGVIRLMKKRNGKKVTLMLNGERELNSNLLIARR